MQIALTEEASGFVARLVASGAFASPEEAVSEALRLLRRDRELDAALADGIRDFEQGRYRDIVAKVAYEPLQFRGIRSSRRRHACDLALRF
jgi:putative addiction module CopG family antidote